MCPVTGFQFVLEVCGVFGLAFFLSSLVFYGVEWAGFKWRDIEKDGRNEPE